VKLSEGVLVSVIMFEQMDLLVSQNQNLATVGCEHDGFSRRRVLRITRRNEPAFTWA